MRFVLYIILLFIVYGCATVHQGNFNKRKYLNLHLKPVYSESVVNNENSLQNAKSQLKDNEEKNDSIIEFGVSAIKLEKTTSPISLTDTDAIKSDIIKTRKKSKQEKKDEQINKSQTNFLTEITKEKQTYHALGFTLFFALLGLTYYLSRKSNLFFKLAFWAKKNSKKSVLIIAVAKVAFVANALGIGYLLADLGYSSPKWVNTIYLSLTLGAVLMFPLKNSKLGIIGFFKQKILGAVLLLSSMIMLINIANRYHEPLQKTDAKNSALVFEKMSLEKTHTHHFSNVKSLNQSDDENALAKSFIVLLMFVIGALLFASILAFACELSCMGFVVFSNIFLIGGSAILIFIFFVLLIRLMKLGNETQEEIKNKKTTAYLLGNTGLFLSVFGAFIPLIWLFLDEYTKSEIDLLSTAITSFALLVIGLLFFIFYLVATQ